MTCSQLHARALIGVLSPSHHLSSISFSFLELSKRVEPVRYISFTYLSCEQIIVVNAVQGVPNQLMLSLIWFLITISWTQCFIWYRSCCINSDHQGVSVCDFFLATSLIGVLSPYHDLRISFSYLELSALVESALCISLTYHSCEQIRVVNVMQGMSQINMLSLIGVLSSSWYKVVASVSTISLYRFHLSIQ